MSGLRSALAVLLLLAAASVTGASPMYYTFRGTIDYAYDYNSGTAASSLGGFEVGVSIVTWTFLVDTDAVGYVVYNGVTWPYPYTDRFYDEFYSGEAVPSTGSGGGHDTDNRLAYNSAALVPAQSASFSLLGSAYPNKNNNYVSIGKDHLFGEVYLGEPGFVGVSGVEDLYGTGYSGVFGFIRGSNFELIRISDTPPEPADTTPPTITDVSTKPSVLWPPSHKMVNVTVSYYATDDSGNVTCGLGPVTSNEPIGAKDWRVVDKSHVQLRSERFGDQSGRVYTILITCADASGNAAKQFTQIMVPHDQRSFQSGRPTQEQWTSNSRRR